MSDLQAVQKRYHDRHAREFTFECAEGVLVLNLRDGPKWFPGRVVERLGPVLYKVRVIGQIWRRHVDRLCRTYSRGASTRGGEQ